MQWEKNRSIKLGTEKARLLFSQDMPDYTEQLKRIYRKANRTGRKFNKGIGSKISIPTSIILPYTSNNHLENIIGKINN